jgi:hypothetical protein
VARWILQPAISETEGRPTPGPLDRLLLMGDEQHQLVEQMQMPGQPAGDVEPQHHPHLVGVVVGVVEESVVEQDAFPVLPVVVTPLSIRLRSRRVLSAGLALTRR